MNRIVSIQEHTHPNPEQVERVVVAQSEQTALVVWHLLPGQEIAAHRHPHGQDTWVVISGEAEYLLGGGETRMIKAGDLAIAAPGQTHGARNRGAVPFVFASVVAPSDAGFEVTEP
ncbi:cupin [Magnetospirillum sp. ME-1]|uniref:cupin domain-containing protein n=1 Tax=Magnetospirillum sp. ME-1 TaxID=1639348 RepID=UPI000A17AFEB|nr:cupin domain-containing protein [Magnetospirillum sp. ME-1]ARJ65131.1 cupin [Magnetospirillum sp. ME-1]